MSAPTAHPGGMLGRYRVLEQIGSGGMGVVYRARDERLQRDVAIKLLLPGSIRSTVARHQVRNEALALSRLNHPNIETIFEFDSQDDCDFLVVELIPGSSLDELLQHGPLAEEQAISLAEQLLRGLAAAHEKGIIHRDLKPSNIRLTPDGFLKILDFGLAHLHDAEVEKHERTTETHSTLLSGTLAYMSPEQLHHAAPDARSDIYAAGLVLHEMCTGRRPFTESGALLIDAILNRPAPTPSKFNSAVGPKLDAVILRALEKEPAKRYQSAKEMLEALEQIDGYTPFIARKQLIRVSAALLLLLALALGWLGLKRIKLPTNKYVAVMPFRSIGNDDPAFDQGLTEVVTTKLMEATAAQDVQIVSAHELVTEAVTSAEDAHKKLGVNLAIEGSLQRSGDWTRVSLELVHPPSARALRALTFTVAKSDPFALQDQVIEKVVQMLELEIHNSQLGAKHDTASAEALAAYTRAVGYEERNLNPEDVASAIAQFEHAIQLDPGYAKAHAGLGMALLHRYRQSRNPADIQQAARECEQSEGLRTDSLDAMLCFGKLYLQTGKYEDAATAFQAATQRDSGNDEIYRGLAEAYEKLGRANQAEAAYKSAIHVRPQFALGYDRLGEFYARQSRYADAIAQFSEATRISPDNPSYWSSVGGLYYYTGDYDRAREALERAISLRPSFEAYTNLGYSLFALRRMPDAISAYQAALGLGETQIQAHGNLARAYYWNPPTRHLARAEYESAEKVVEKALQVNPHDLDALLLGAEYSAKLGRAAEANERLGLVLRSRLNDGETLYFAALIAADLGRSREATVWMKKAIAAGYSKSEIAYTPEFANLDKATLQAAMN